MLEWIGGLMIQKGKTVRLFRMLPTQLDHMSVQSRDMCFCFVLLVTMT